MFYEKAHINNQTCKLPTNYHTGVTFCHSFDTNYSSTDVIITRLHLTTNYTK